MSNASKYTWERKKCCNSADWWSGFEANFNTQPSSYTEIPYNCEYFYVNNRTVSAINSPKGQPGIRIEMTNLDGSSAIDFYMKNYPFNSGTSATCVMDCGSKYHKCMYVLPGSDGAVRLNEGFKVWDHM